MKPNWSLSKKSTLLSASSILELTKACDLNGDWIPLGNVAQCACILQRKLANLIDTKCFEIL